MGLGRMQGNAIQTKGEDIIIKTVFWIGLGIVTFIFMFLFIADLIFKIII